jgi:hypothetical protein
LIRDGDIDGHVFIGSLPLPRKCITGMLPGTQERPVTTGAHSGGERVAAIMSLIRSARLDGHDAYA